jgi:Protein N-terminal asparagine amidohydrolase
MHIEVLQGEHALVDATCEPGTADVSLASAEATTCCVLVLRCLQSHRVLLAHLDESSMKDAVLLSRALQGMTQVCIHLQGSRSDSCMRA